VCGPRAARLEPWSQPTHSGEHFDACNRNFSSLFAWLASPRGYLQGIEGAFAFATGKSFYERLFPDEYVDIGWSANAVHWLSRVPCTIVDHLCYWRGTPDLDQLFRAQAAADWRAFFEHRARELRVGGHLVVVVVRVDDQRRSGGDHFVDVINEALVDLLSVGKLRRHEYDRMSIATYFRTVDEIEAPFQSGPVSSSLDLEAHEQTVLRDPIGEEYDATRDAVAFARAYTGWLRGFSERSLIGALDPDRTHEAVAAFADELYDNITALVRRDPTGMRCHWKLSQLLVTKRARVL
jgi:S-adenosylmethionine-dependent carboxyl methyltransferase